EREPRGRRPVGDRVAQAVRADRGAARTADGDVPPGVRPAGGDARRLPPSGIRAAFRGGGRGDGRGAPLRRGRPGRGRRAIDGARRTARPDRYSARPARAAAHDRAGPAQGRRADPGGPRLPHRPARPPGRRGEAEHPAAGGRTGAGERVAPAGPPRVPARGVRDRPLSRPRSAGDAPRTGRAAHDAPPSTTPPDAPRVLTGRAACAWRARGGDAEGCPPEPRRDPRRTPSPVTELTASQRRRTPRAAANRTRAPAFSIRWISTGPPG